MSTKSSTISTKRPAPAKRAKHFALCINNEGYEASLEPRKFYVAISDPDAESHDQLRVIDESGEDYLFPAEFFAQPKVSPSLLRLLQRAV